MLCCLTKILARKKTPIKNHHLHSCISKKVPKLSTNMQTNKSKSKRENNILLLEIKSLRILTSPMMKQKKMKGRPQSLINYNASALTATTWYFLMTSMHTNSSARLS